jgi:hypothetical protein
MRPVLLPQTVPRNAIVLAPPSVLGNVALGELFGGPEGFGHKIRTALFIGTVGDCRRSAEQDHPQESLVAHGGALAQ